MVRKRASCWIPPCTCFGCLGYFPTLGMPFEAPWLWLTLGSDPHHHLSAWEVFFGRKVEEEEAVMVVPHMIFWSIWREKSKRI